MGSWFLRSALRWIVRRHESLRTTFASEGGRPYQQAHDAAEPRFQLQIPIVDLTDLPSEAQPREVARQAREDAAKPFDLRHDLLLRAALLVLGPTASRTCLCASSTTSADRIRSTLRRHDASTNTTGTSQRASYRCDLNGTNRTRQRGPTGDRCRTHGVGVSSLCWRATNPLAG